MCVGQYAMDSDLALVQRVQVHPQILSAPVVRAETLPAVVALRVLLPTNRSSTAVVGPEIFFLLFERRFFFFFFLRMVTVKKKKKKYLLKFGTCQFASLVYFKPVLP